MIVIFTCVYLSGNMIMVLANENISIDQNQQIIPVQESGKEEKAVVEEEKPEIEEEKQVEELESTENIMETRGSSPTVIVTPSSHEVAKGE